MDAPRRLSAEAAAALRRALPFAEDLEEPAFAALTAACEAHSYRFGEVAVEEGEPADAAYVVVAGRARALKRDRRGHEQHLSVLHEGDLFGEIALVRGGVRTATVRASDALTLVRLGRSEVARLAERFPAVQALFERTARLREVQDLLRKGPLRLLEPAARSRLAMALAVVPPRAAVAGEEVVREGDPPGPWFIIEEGRFRARRGAGAAARDVGFLRPGDSFGELGALTGRGRTATVVASTEGRLLPLARDALEDLLGEVPALERFFQEQASRYSDAPLAKPLDFASAVQHKGYAGVEAHAAALLGLAAEDLAVAQEPAEGDGAGAGVALLAPGAATARALRGFPLVRQIDEADCGPACLAMACRWYGRRVPLHRLRDLARTRTGGASLKALARAARAVGLHAAPVKLGKRDLERVPLPALVHVHGGHWACLVGVGPRGVHLADPARGRLWMEREGAEGFERAWSGFALLLARGEGLDREPEAATGALRRFLRDLVRGGERRLALAAGLSAAAAGLAVATAWVLGALGEMAVMVAELAGAPRLAAVPTTAERAALLAAGSAVFLLAARLGVRALRGGMLAGLERGLDARAFSLLAGTLFAQPLRYFLERRPGDLEGRLAASRTLSRLIADAAGPAVEAAAFLVLALPVLLVFDARLGAVVAGVGWLGGLAAVAAARAGRRGGLGEREEERSAHGALIAEAVRAAETIQASGAAEAVARRLGARFAALLDDDAPAEGAERRQRALGEGLGLVLVAVALLGGALELAAGRLAVGSLVAVVALAAMGAQALGALAGFAGRLAGAGRTLRRVEDLLEQEPEERRGVPGERGGGAGASGPGASGAGGSGAGGSGPAPHERGGAPPVRLPVPSLSGAFAVEDLAVRYGGPESPLALDGVSFAVAAGARIGLTGRRGAGKTTLVRALAGLVEPVRGAVRYDGLDLRALRLAELRGHLGVAPEAPELLTGTLAENVSLGEPPDGPRLRGALAAACAEKLVEGLPLGVDSPLGAGGTPIGREEAQRIGVARAAYRRPTVLILDEAASLLDPEAERRIVLALERQLTGSTLVVVTDRAATLRALDRVLVLDGGRLVEEGTHDDLLRRRGVYAHLVGSA